MPVSGEVVRLIATTSSRPKGAWPAFPCAGSRLPSRAVRKRVLYEGNQRAAQLAPLESVMAVAVNLHQLPSLAAWPGRVHSGAASDPRPPQSRLHYLPAQLSSERCMPSVPPRYSAASIGPKFALQVRGAACPPPSIPAASVGSRVRLFCGSQAPRPQRSYSYARISRRPRRSESPSASDARRRLSIPSVI